MFVPPRVRHDGGAPPPRVVDESLIDLHGVAELSKPKLAWLTASSARVGQGGTDDASRTRGSTGRVQREDNPLASYGVGATALAVLVAVSCFASRQPALPNVEPGLPARSRVCTRVSGW